MKALKNFAKNVVLAASGISLLAGVSVAQSQTEKNISEGSKQSPDTITTNQEEMLIDLLDSSLHSLSDKDREGRMIGGYVLLGLGKGTALGGAAVLAFGEGDDARTVGYSLIGGGALLGGLSLIPFKIKSETERIYAEFSRAPADTPEQIRRKFYYWDRRFEELAHKRKRERIIGGVTSIVAGGVASLLLVEGTDEDRLHAFIWPTVGGIAGILIKSDEERRFETYSRTKEDILGQKTVTEIYIGFVPLPEGGIGGTVRVRF